VTTRDLQGIHPGGTLDREEHGRKKQMKTIATITYRAFAIFAFAFSGLLQMAHAVSPAPDGGYPGGNTAEGQNALFSLTSGGYNTAVGYLSLRSESTASFNTAIGAGTLLANTADENTATGAGALLSNTAANHNTADGAFALFSNTTGGDNTAIGDQALFKNTTANGNTADGTFALFSNTTGADNTAIGDVALVANTTGLSNTAIGVAALGSNSTGGSNIALGFNAGLNLTTGNNNIDIGNSGATGDADIIRIGTQGIQTFTIIAGISNDIQAIGTPVIVTTDGYLGVATSSARFKDQIKPMDKASEALFGLNPVTFRYKRQIDPAGTGQFGLVAEEVEKVNPDLVVRDKEGKPYSVRYEQVNAMLLNEFLKEHRKVENLKNDFQTTVAQQQKEIADLTATVKEQAVQIQKVSAQLAAASPSGDGLEASKPAPQVVLSNR
jgi:trimeric autotransporter adhesin